MHVARRNGASVKSLFSAKIRVMKKLLLPLLILSAIILAGCGSSSPDSSSPKPTVNIKEEVTEPETASGQTATANQTNRTTIYLIKLDDNGETQNSIKIGCGDSAIPIEATVNYLYDATDPQQAVNAAFIALANTTEQQYSHKNLLNISGRSTWKLPDIEKQKNKIIVHLDGTFTFNGVCDQPRLKAQFEETAKKAAGKLPVSFTLNDSAAAWDKLFSNK